MARRKQGARRVVAAEPAPRFRRWMLVPMAAGVAALAIFALAQEIVTLPERDFPIRTLKVEASFERVSADEVRAVVTPLVAAGFFDTSVDAVKQSLTALPWVQAVAVRRVWPDTLHITVIEQQAVALWADEGLLNPQGELFRPDDFVPTADLPRLVGPPRSSPQVMGQYQRLNAQLAPLGLGIERLAMDSRRAWQIELSNGMTLVLGRRGTEEQIERFTRYWPGTLAARAADIAEVDLRYPNGFAVRWHEAGATARAQATGKTGDRV